MAHSSTVAGLDCAGRLRPVLERRIGGPALVLVATACAYAGLARAGQQLADVQSGIASFWPPNGFVLGILLLCTSRRLRLATLAAIVPGELLADWLNHQPIATAAGWAAANTIEVLVAGSILALVAGRMPRGDRLRDLVALGAASAVGPALGATIGGAASYATFGGTYGNAWLMWWGGDATGIILVTPLVLSFARREGISLRRTALGLANVALVILAAVAVYGLQTMPLQFLVLPPLIVLSVVYGLRETALAGVSFSIAATVLTGHGHGPLAAIASPEHRIWILESFIATTAFVGYLICAVMSERREAEATLREIATHDSLTGLANRRLFLEQLDKAAARSARSVEDKAVIYLDVDDFKRFNDELGHAAGDAVLVATGERLATSLRAGDLGARIGGDEFAVVLDPVDGLPGAERAVERLKAALSEPVLWDGRVLDVHVSAGGSIIGPNAVATLGNADRRLYADKALRRRQRGRRARRVRTVASR